MILAAIEGADDILVTTDYVRDQLVRSIIDLPLERFLVLPCGTDLDEFRSGRSAEIVKKYALSERYVICPGALTTAKGPQNVVEASLEYADLAPTIFLGDEELREQLEMMAREGRSRAQEHFSWIKLGGTLANWLEQISSA